MYILITPYEYYILLTVNLLLLLYGPAPVLQQLGLDTEPIIVPFSSKRLNHMAYLINVDTVILCDTVWLTVTQLFSDISNIDYSLRTNNYCTP